MPLASTREPPARAHDLVMLDLDGVVYVGPDAVPHAADTLSRVAANGGRLAYLTNNASRTAAEVAAHLRELGMPVSDDGEVVTSAQAVARLVAGSVPAGSRVLLVGGDGLRGPLEESGLECVDSADADPVAVVQGFHPTVGWTQLAEASAAVGAGVPWFASNTDLTIPTPRGRAPGNGSLVQAVANATGRSPVVAGKPERPLFDETLRRTGACRPLMVGDRLDTDIDGAIGAGIPSLLVLTGVSTLDEAAAAARGSRPDLVSFDLRGLLEEHPAVEVVGEEAQCGGSGAVLRDGVVIPADGTARGSTTGLRSALALAWDRLDTTGEPVQVPDDAWVG